MTKMTYAVAFTKAIATLEAIDTFDTEALARLKDALEREQKPKAQTKTQKENDLAKPIVLDALRKVGTPCTVSQLLKSVTTIEGFEDYTTSKLTAILTKLKNDNSVERVIEKKVSYYSVTE